MIDSRRNGEHHRLSRGLSPTRLRERAQFLGQALREMRDIGAFLPSSRAVADLMASALPRRRGGPRRLLEVGAGTGAITRALVRDLEPQDELDLCEINPAFARELRVKFGSDPRVRVLEQDVASLDATQRYDGAVASLPLLNMPAEAVETSFTRVLEELLEPGARLVYFGYLGNGLRRFVPASRAERDRVRAVLEVERQVLSRHQVARTIVLKNFPPAHVHVLQA